MLTSRALLALLVLFAGLGVFGIALAQDSAEGKKRRELEKSLGIEGKKSASKEGDAADEPGASHDDERAEATDEPSEKQNTPKVSEPAAHVTNYVDDVRRVLQSKCASCHKTGGGAAGTRLHFTGRAFADYKAVLPFVNRSDPARSLLVTKSEGVAHVGGKSLPKGSAGHATLISWIKAGALYKQPEPTPAASPKAGTSKTSPQAVGKARPAKKAVRRRSAPQPAKELPTDVPDKPVAEPQSWGDISKQATTAEAKTQPVQTYLPFAPAVHQMLTTACGSCHAEGQFAGGSAYRVDSDPHAHFVTASSLVSSGSAQKSKLYLYALGHEHAAGAVFTAASDEAKLLAQWIEEGAHEFAQPPASDSPAANAQAPASGELPTNTTVDGSATVQGRADGASAHGASAPGGSPHGGGHGGISLMSHPVLGTLTLNGRFDLNYERRNFTGSPLAHDADDVLRSYHHFVFLTRQSEQDPVTIKVEMLTLQFWEISMALSPEEWPVKVSTTLGKILVPFGSEPLFHQTYGGLAGFDQRVVPTVFAREGVKLDAQAEWEGFTFAADLYAIAGYRLREASAELNLQSDFAPLEEVRLGFGLRLGAAYGPISAWYSAYLNKLGFGRQLFMQAVDVALWRPRGIDVLEHFSLGAGFLRADVSGGEAEGYGGPNADYYHFASYFQLRFYPVDWLYLQYRQGLRTMTNRRGFYIDETDLTSADASTHNVGISARYRGLSVGLFHFWNLEKADEVADDFTRLVVAYDF